MTALWAHTYTGTPPTPWRKKLSFMKRKPVVAGTSALVLVLELVASMNRSLGYQTRGWKGTVGWGQKKWTYFASTVLGTRCGTLKRETLISVLLLLGVPVDSLTNVIQVPEARSDSWVMIKSFSISHNFLWKANIGLTQTINTAHKTFLSPATRRQQLLYKQVLSSHQMIRNNENDKKNNPSIECRVFQNSISKYLRKCNKRFYCQTPHGLVISS